MKKIILVLIAICSIQVVHSQNLDQATVNKIRVKLIGAEKLYEQGEYWETLEKIKEIEELSKGMKSAKIQNLKVKAYLGAEMFQKSKEELDRLYNMNPADAVIEDIASYESEIDKGIKDSIAKKERERLAEIKRREEVKHSEMLREQDAKKKVKKIERSYLAFKNQFNIETNNFVSYNANNEAGLMSKEGKLLIPYGNYRVEHFSNSLFLFYNRTGEHRYSIVDVKSGIFKLKNYATIGKLKNGSAIISPDHFKKGLINSNASIITDEWYYRIDEIAEGMRLVKKDTGVKDRYGVTIWKCGFIDLAGKVQIPLIYQFGFKFSDGLAPVEKFGKYGYINKNGETIIPFIFDFGYGFKNGKARVSKKPKKYFTIDKKGKKGTILKSV